MTEAQKQIRRDKKNRKGNTTMDSFLIPPSNNDANNNSSEGADESSTAVSDNDAVTFSDITNTSIRRVPRPIIANMEAEDGRMQHEQSSGMNNKVGCCWNNLRWIIRRRCHAIWLDSDDNQLVTVTGWYRGGRSNNKPNNCRRSKSNERREMIEYIIYAPTILVLELIIIVFKLHQSLIAKSTNSQ